MAKKLIQSNGFTFLFGFIAFFLGSAAIAASMIEIITSGGLPAIDAWLTSVMAVGLLFVYLGLSLLLQAGLGAFYNEYLWLEKTNEVSNIPTSPESK